jgi:branched-chain amino acid transport system permease protein
MEQSLSTFFDQTVNGLVIGNVYALIAVGLAVIFGVANLINFAHGSVYMVGAYVGWYGATQLQLPLPLVFILVAAVCAVLGILIERFGLRHLHSSARIAPLLATIGISFILDQLVQIVFTPDPQRFSNPLPQTRIPIGSTSIGLIDILIAVVGIGTAALLYLFLRYTKLGWALRATAQDREAAQQMGVDVNTVNRTAFALAAMLGGIAGLLVGMYLQTVYPTMSSQAVLKGFAANLLGGLGSIPGALLGGLLLGLIESYGVALFGSSYRSLFAFIILIAMLLFRPNGLLNTKRQLPPEPMTGTFIPNTRRLKIPRWAIFGAVIIAVLLPFVYPNPYIMQVFTNAWLIALVALSVTLVTGTAGQISLGQSGFLAIGAYTSALLTLRLGIPFEIALIAAALFTALLGTLLVLPAFRLRAHYVAIATIGISEIISQVILNWRPVTNGALGLTNIPPPSLLGVALFKPQEVYLFTFALLMLAALLQWRLVRSSLGRVWRALREDDVAAQAYGINLNRYKALAFLVSAFIAGLSGAFSAHMYSYINYQTFPLSLSILALTMAILGGMGSIPGAILGAVVLTLLPELFRDLVQYRYLLYGLMLVLLIRFRPQGLVGTGDA